MQSEEHTVETGPMPKTLEGMLERGLRTLPKGVELIKTDDGFKLVHNRTSSNKYLGQDKPKLSETNFHGKSRKGARNEFGFDPVTRAKETAKAAVKNRLKGVMARHGNE